MKKRMTFKELENILGRELTAIEICDIGIAAIDGKSDEQIVAELKAKQLKEAVPNLFSTTEHTERLTPSQNTQKGTSNSSVCSVSAEGGFCDFSGQKTPARNLPDIGFRVLKCDTSNMKEVYYNPAEYEASLFSRLEDNIKYITCDREAGNVIDEFATLSEAEAAICTYEEEDRANGCYEDNFYMIKVNEEA